MDKGVTIVGIVLALICLVPLVMANLDKKRKNIVVIKSLHNYAEQHLCKISEYDMWGQAAIGIDKNNCILFYFKQEGRAMNMQQVPLKGISKCYIKGEQKNYHNIEKLELVFTPAGHMPETALEFYDSTVQIEMDNELQLIKKWRDIANSCLKQAHTV